MVRLYLMLIVLAVLGSVGAGAFWYYKDTQQRIQTLQENNAKLEVALQTSEESINALQADMAKFSELNNKLSIALQKAESYGDELRSKLSKLNLVVEALKDSKVLEGKMNGASAKLWREFMEDTGNVTKVEKTQVPTIARPKPLQLSDTRIFVVTKDNYEEFVKEFTETYGELAFVALSMKDYENLALNVADIRRYLNQQSEIILYYEKAVTPEQPAQQ